MYVCCRRKETEQKRKKQNRTEQNGSVGRDLQRPSLPTARALQGWEQLGHITEGIAQMPLEHWQARGSIQLPRKPVAVCEHPHIKETFPDVQFSQPQRSSMVFPYVLSLSSSLYHQGEETSASLSFILQFLLLGIFWFIIILVLMLHSIFDRILIILHKAWTVFLLHGVHC